MCFRDKGSLVDDLSGLRDLFYQSCGLRINTADIVLKFQIIHNLLSVRDLQLTTALNRSEHQLSSALLKTSSKCRERKGTVHDQEAGSIRA